uniref:Uncharacterized protein n=2 Tax=Parascaris univalens TaxID=6257 RepID=A0A915AWT8_PARUN
SHGSTLAAATCFVSRHLFDLIGGFHRERSIGYPEDLSFFYSGFRKLCWFLMAPKNPWEFRPREKLLHGANNVVRSCQQFVWDICQFSIFFFFEKRRVIAGNFTDVLKFWSHNSLMGCYPYELLFPARFVDMLVFQDLASTAFLTPALFL